MFFRVEMLEELSLRRTEVLNRWDKSSSSFTSPFRAFLRSSFIVDSGSLDGSEPRVMLGSEKVKGKTYFSLQREYLPGLWSQED